MADTPFTLDVPEAFGPVADAFRANFADDLEIGAQFAAVRNGRPLLSLTGGHADRKRTTPLRADHLIAVFSSGKAVAALVVALAVERGQLDYDAPVSRYWPEFAAEGKADLTLAQCLSHQAGLSGITDPDFTPADWFDWDMTCATLAAQTPIFPPGSTSGYHPVTYGFLAGEPIRRATDRTLGHTLREDLCAPHDIDIFIGTPASEHARCAEMRKPPGISDFGTITDATTYAFLKPWSSPGGGGIKAWREAELAGSNTHASAEGLATIMQLAATGKLGGQQVLSPDTRVQLTRSRINGPDRVLPFTLDIAAGVMRNTPQNGKNFYGPNAETVGHSGWGGSCTFADPETGLSAAYAMTKQSTSLMGDPRSTRLIDALYACL